MPVSFIKMHGLGNHFVIIDSRESNFMPNKEFCLKVSDPYRGVGYDQLIVLTQAKNSQADLYMHIINSDGSPAGACGNATRCIARLLFEEDRSKNEGVIETTAGLLHVKDLGEEIYSADMGPARLEWHEIPLAKEMDTLAIKLEDAPLGLKGCCVNVGNPHMVFFVPDLEAIDIAAIGSKLEVNSLFPDRCNIEFAQVLDDKHIRMRVWERGTGITQACGSGACATLVAAVRQNLIKGREATIHLDGGDLMVHWRKNDEHVILAGTATKSFNGQLFDELTA